MSFASLRLSSAEVPQADRLEFLRENYGRTVLKVDMEPIGNGPFDTQMMLHALPGLGVATGTCSQLAVHHTAQLADNDDLVLLMATRGATVMRHRGREEMISDGEALLTSGAEAGFNRMQSPIGFINFNLPAKVLAPMIGDLSRVLMQPLRRDNPALKLLAGYFRALDAMDAVPGPDVGRLVATHVHDLVAMAVGATREAAEIARGRGVRAARLRTIKEDIQAMLGRPELAAHHVAHRHGVSERYLRKLFEFDGTSFSAFALGQRLAQVHRQLGEQRHAGDAISTLAFAAGFNDLSYFNRAFRRCYGATPSDIRAASRC